MASSKWRSFQAIFRGNVPADAEHRFIEEYGTSGMLEDCPGCPECPPTDTPEQQGIEGEDCVECGGSGCIGPSSMSVEAIDDHAVCPDCRGTGKEPLGAECVVCGGDGIDPMPMDISDAGQPCPGCDGTGKQLAPDISGTNDELCRDQAAPTTTSAAESRQDTTQDNTPNQPEGAERFLFEWIGQDVLRPSGAVQCAVGSTVTAQRLVDEAVNPTIRAAFAAGLEAGERREKHTIELAGMVRWLIHDAPYQAPEITGPAIENMRRRLTEIEAEALTHTQEDGE